MDERPVVVVAPAPAPAPAPSTSQPRATAKPRATATAEATAEPTPEATPEATPIAADLTLSALGLSGVTLSPAFDAETGTYTASVANDVDSTTVTASATNADATVAITAPDDADAATDGHQVALAEGADTTITIEVKVGEDTATYTVTVTRAAALPEGAVLSTLSLSDVNLSPGFSSEITSYTASVVNGINSTTVTATVPTGARLGILPPDATTDVPGEANTIGHQVDLAPGADTTIDIAVTAGDVTTFYKIVISRGAAAADATLSTLSLGTDVTLDPAFSRHTYSYTANCAEQRRGRDCRARR